MSEFEWIVAALTVFSALLLPTLAILVRGAVKWTRTEDKLAELVGSIRQLMTDKDKTHADMLGQMARERQDSNATHKEILEQMRVDREATDRRLRFIEEFWMAEGKKAFNRT